MYGNNEFKKKTPFSITGIVEWLGQEQVLGAKGFRKREIVIADDPRNEHPNYTLVEFKQDKCDLLRGVTKGQEVTIGFFTDARWWEPKDGQKPGRWFCSLRGVSLTVSGAAELGAAPSQEEDDPTPASEPDLPF